jgi:hypothetical protein
MGMESWRNLQWRTKNQQKTKEMKQNDMEETIVGLFKEVNEKLYKETKLATPIHLHQQKKSSSEQLIIRQQH